MLTLISCNSFFSFFVSIKNPIDTVVQNQAFDDQLRDCLCLLYSGVISESQPTVRGHTLTRCPLPGRRVAAAPSTPERPKP